MRQIARIGKYKDWITEDGLTSVEGWAREGLSDTQIADKIGIAVQTMYEWERRFPSFLEALKRGKAPVDTQVENALLKSALGFYVTVMKPVKLKTEKQLAGKGKIVEERIEYVEEQVYIPPQNTAQIFWLKNRKPEQWRDKREIIDTEANEKLDAILEEMDRNAF